MSNQSEWRQFFEKRSIPVLSDFEFDHGTNPGTEELEYLSQQELLEFIDPTQADVVLDAGCGTGSNILLLHSKVRRIIAMDYTVSALERTRQRITSNNIRNADAIQGSVTDIPLPDSSVDKVVCMSVFQYLNDVELRRALSEFARVLKDRGTLILHVKNRSSLYLLTLCLAKRIKRWLGKSIQPEHFRPYRWYVNELISSGFQVISYNSFNLFTIDLMPKRLVALLRKLELTYYQRFPLRTEFARRHGADLKVKCRAGMSH